MRILFVANVDWFFISHRLPLAQEAVKNNWEVYLLAGDTGVGHEVQKHGIQYIPWEVSRAGKNPLNELKSLLFLYKMYKKVNPDIIHQVAMKPVLYGTLIARILGTKKTINALSGLGYSFTDNRKTGKFLLVFLRFVLSYTKNKLILQNQDDSLLFIENKIIQKDKIVIIKGSGVDSKVFQKVEEPKNDPLIIMLPSRMLIDKGVREFVNVAQNLKDRQNLKFVLVGGIDKENPAWIAEEEILEWVKEGFVDWWGHQKDMRAILAKANIVVLPSYREGLPKVLIEASMLERAIITTDVPGCREIIKHEVNGLLVPSQNVIELENAILRLAIDSELRLQLAQNAHEIAIQEYSIDKVIQDTFSLYQ
ncbi:glycosyltransferase family 4 protein [Emticicia fontis]